MVTRVCEPKKKEMRGELRKKHDVELQKVSFVAMHSVPIIEERNSYKILVESLEA
jgi:hypothetical protein